MAKSDTRRIQLTDIKEAIALLTRLPVSADGFRGARAAWAYPVAGAVVAFLAGFVGVLAHALGLPNGIVAGLVLVALIMMTGAMHEDGLADCADGFWGGWNPARRLEIMKDSDVGTYGVIALVLSLIARWSAIAALVGSGWLMAPLIAAAVLSRAPMVGAMHWLAPARRSGLSEAVGRPDQETVVLAATVALLAAVLLAGPIALIAALTAALLASGVAAVAQAKISGQTGDVLGATQQIAEIGVLAVFTASVT